jgi:alkanesulfonate monooxygenase SsuD/methylene tetrahydromethanopterin reductase-like flavin-dependent oxidoreductase (luciferase family)
MTQLHLAVALDGAGWHPAAWREPTARPADLFTPAYWIDLAQEAEHGLLDFVTIEDSLTLQSVRYDGHDERTDQVRGRLDAVLIASRVAQHTRHIGLVPTATTTHTEPFHVSTALATLDYVSLGRGGWRVQVGRPHEAPHFGRRPLPALDLADLSSPHNQAVLHELFGEAADAIEVVRRLWDSWEDDAVIRDVTTGRFVDRDRLHYIDFEGRHFSVKGPSIVPRPPQGQLPVAVLAHSRIPYELAARGADVVSVTPTDRDDARRIVAEVREAERAVGRTGAPLQVWADLVVFLDGEQDRAADRKASLDRKAFDREAGATLTSDAAIVVGTPEELAIQLLDWHAAGIDGFRLRPGVLPHDLRRITSGLVPLLQQAGAFRTRYEASTLRGLLGLPAAPNRYQTARPQTVAA